MFKQIILYMFLILIVSSITGFEFGYLYGESQGWSRGISDCFRIQGKTKKEVDIPIR